MKDVNVTECSFSVDIPPYMYGELTLSEQAAFESHLVDCAECTDEFAAISNARYEIYDWKKVDFDPLETPRFEIPFEESVPSVSWVDKLRSAFSNGWAVPGFAFAGLAIVAVFAAVFVPQGDNSPEVVTKVSKTEAVESQEQTPAPVAASKASVDDPNESNSPDTPEAPVTKPSIPKRAVRSDRPVRTYVEPREASASKVQPKVPTLNEPVEEEDNSLRLAELFDDVETSD